LIIFLFSTHLRSQDQDGEGEGDQQTTQELSQESDKSITETTENESKGFLGINLSEMKKKLLEKYTKGNPLSNMDRQSVKDTVTGRLYQSQWNNFFKNNPTIVEFITDVLHDKKAMPSLFQILNQPSKTKKYGFCVIVLIIMSFLFGGSKGGFFARIFKRLFVNLSCCTLSLIAFYLIFQEELTPTIELFTHRFF